ncbi:MAG: rRNA biogenesis protein Nop56/Nop58 [halophilic archaeon J07HX5]|jgi:rRNA biogenesis protein Nop56/Nop58|nr:MAG: rRNA biogenesis protein Nop56/Nop58 [halophilic archaeon J07HX5]
MTDDAGWFSSLDGASETGSDGGTDGWLEDARSAIATGQADTPADWPARAVTAGAAADTEAYYDQLHDATVAATRALVQEREQADDQQLIHAVRALDDCQRTRNELTERLAEWAGTHGTDVTGDPASVQALADRNPEAPTERRLASLAERIRALAGEAERLRTYIEQTTPPVAPNLAALAGPVLAVRLLALAGGLADLAKLPSGTVQVLGAEDALFAHLQGHAPSPKHGVIYTHEYVRGTRADERGSAARALAGKLTIAARIDHYSGESRPELAAELDDRIERIRARGDA